MPVNVNTKSRTDLKGYFIRGARPTAAQFGELIDSALNAKDDGVFKSGASPLQIQAESGAGSMQRVVEFYKSFADANPSWTMQLNTNQSPAAGLDIRSGGKSRLFIEEGGNGRVGIGTTTPVMSLEVRSPSLYGGPAVGVVSENNRYLFLHASNGDPALIWSSGTQLRFGVSDPAVANAGTTWKEYMRIHNGGLLFPGHDKIWTDIAQQSDQAGNGSIFNEGATYNALMILGRRRSERANTDQRRVVKIWDHLEINSFFRAPVDRDNMTLQVNGPIAAANSDIYFTNTEHNHTGWGNEPGQAAIENAKNFDALMILGRARARGPRIVKLWDYLEVQGDLKVIGEIEAGRIRGFPLGSSRSYKKNIQPFEGREAMKIFSEITPVKFHFKEDEDEAPLRMGFIAEDTPVEISGEKRDKIELSHLVSLLTLVVKNLSAELTELKLAISKETH